MFLTSIESGGERHSGKTVVIKTARRYNAKAHRLLAEVGHAPELLYCSTEDSNPEDLGGLILVVMGFVGGSTAHEWYGINPLPPPIFSKVQEATTVLHAENIVFGDLRPPNIMVTEDERVMLIDFDGCGVHAEGTYPFSLNDAQKSSGSIDWHPDFTRGGKMLKEHDIYRLNSMKPLKLSRRCISHFQFTI